MLKNNVKDLSDKDALLIEDESSIVTNIFNLNSYDEFINTKNILLDIIKPLCRIEPSDKEFNLKLCDCDELKYSDLLDRYKKNNNNISIPKLPGRRGIISYLNALLGVICLADKKNMIVDHNIFFDAIKDDLYNNNNTLSIVDNNLYDAILIDYNNYLKKKKKFLNEFKKE